MTNLKIKKTIFPEKTDNFNNWVDRVFKKSTSLEDEIIDLVKNTPNDQELGGKIRQLINNLNK